MTLPDSLKTEQAADRLQALFVVLVAIAVVMAIAVAVLGVRAEETRSDVTNVTRRVTNIERPTKLQLQQGLDRAIQTMTAAQARRLLGRLLAAASPAQRVRLRRVAVLRARPPVRLRRSSPVVRRRVPKGRTAPTVRPAPPPPVVAPVPPPPPPPPVPPPPRPVPVPPVAQPFAGEPGKGAKPGAAALGEKQPGGERGALSGEKQEPPGKGKKPKE